LTIFLIISNMFLGFDLTFSILKFSHALCVINKETRETVSTHGHSASYIIF
jgi:hypothetical protein